jgi:S-adenosylmethionine-diacylgycerolhomoserine-N-methlytransferase
MLETAQQSFDRHGLAARVRFAQALGETVDPHATFGLDRRFDVVMLPYVLSMIPTWPATVANAVRIVAPGGSLHVVDFGDQTGLPRPLRRLIEGWLGLFHVVPRRELVDEFRRAAAGMGKELTHQRILGGYADRLTVTD